MKILIYGFGRMGITHYSILNGLSRKHDFYIIEPNNILRYLLKKNINAKFYKNDQKLNFYFDLTLITTPPFLHKDLLKKSIIRGDKKIFIEKPFGGHNNFNYDDIYKKSIIKIGYVLRFNPCIQWVKSNVAPSQISKIYAEYQSNTIQKKPVGWRNGNYSGVLNEMGSHILDLIFYVTESNNFSVKSSDKKSIYSDVDDIIKSNIKDNKNQIDISLYFNWVNEKIRKPVFNINIELKNQDKILVNQQIIKIINRSCH